MRAVEAGVSDYSALNDIAASGESDRCLFALGFGSSTSYYVAVS